MLNQPDMCLTCSCVCHDACLRTHPLTAMLNFVCASGQATYHTAAHAYLAQHWQQEAAWQSPSYYWPSHDNMAWPSAVVLVSEAHQTDEAAAVQHRKALSLMWEGWLKGKVSATVDGWYMQRSARLRRWGRLAHRAYHETCDEAAAATTIAAAATEVCMRESYLACSVQHTA
jgi:hypothetical protein